MTRARIRNVGGRNRPHAAWLYTAPLKAFLIITLVLIWSCHARDQAEDALDRARQFARDGKFEEALQKYIWFHDHALSVDRSYYGVRLSYALAEWVELGKNYPKALVELKAIRDKKTSQLLAGTADRHLFHDVESINKYLTESKATVDLFKKIDAAKTEFASSIYDLAEEPLVEAQEFSLARKYVGDPTERFASAKRKYEEQIRFFPGTGYKHAVENIFADEMARLIKVLDKTGDRARAQEIQTESLKVVNSSAIRDVLKP